MEGVDLIKLKHIRQNHGITLKQLQTLSGISKTDLYEIENETGDHSLDKIEKYTSALQTELSNKRA